MKLINYSEEEKKNMIIIESRKRLSFQFNQEKGSTLLRHCESNSIMLPSPHYSFISFEKHISKKTKKKIRICDMFDQSKERTDIQVHNNKTLPIIYPAAPPTLLMSRPFLLPTQNSLLQRCVCVYTSTI